MCECILLTESHSVKPVMSRDIFSVRNQVDFLGKMVQNLCFNGEIVFYAGT